jgi:S1-C subfamily serine protease
MAVESWMDLSDGLATIVERVAGAVVRVDGGRRASGSGVAWSADAVVTASHWLDGEEEAEVGLASGETASAQVLGRDPTTDLAVLRVKGGGLAPPEWSEAPLRVGQLALAVTRPGRGPRASLGLVSRVGDAFRTHAGGKLDRWVELDIGLYTGFSGGLVLDLAGRAVGLATAGLVRGTPLAVPPTTLRRVVKAILSHGTVRRGYLGVSSFPVRLPPGVESAVGQRSGLLLTAVEEDSPAGRAGLTMGDVLLTLDGVPVGHMGDLLPLLEEERIGDVATARIVRAGAVQELKVTIGARGARREGGSP